MDLTAPSVDHLRAFGQVALVHPVALQFGPLTITWYGVMVALGFVVGIWNASRRAPFAGIHADKLVDIGPWLIIGGLVAARVLYVVTFWSEQFAASPFPAVFEVWHGGLVFYGGFIGAALATIIWARLKKLPMWVLGDILAPSLALGYAFGRLGCLLNGCCYGRECSLPWAIRFPESHQTFPHRLHPTQVYEALLSIGLFLVLTRIFARRKFDGQVFVCYLLGYSLLRFAGEFFRGDYPPELRYFGGAITPAQLLSAVVLVIGIVLWQALPRRVTCRPAAPRDCPEPVDLATKP